MDRSKADPTVAEATIEDLAEVLIQVASGDLQARAARTGRGDAVDVLAFMINATVEELAGLIGDLRRQRDELRQTQEHLIHIGKLTALGELASGIAHELNQPLTAIRMLVGSARERMHAGDSGLAVEDLDLLTEATERMGSIVHGVLAFARQGAPDSKLLAADAPPRDALRLLGPSLRKEGIEVETAMAADVAAIRGDPGRLQQVFVNLVSNARDALVSSGRARSGRILVGCRVEGDAVVYFVEDDGPGVPEAMRGKIFDPFFTSKEVGAGTGLGLSVSYGIVDEHGGSLRYEEAPRGGARFVVRIPIDDAGGSDV